MLPNSVNVPIDTKAIQSYIKDEIDKQVKLEMWYVDANKIIELTSCSRRFCEDYFFSDPRVKALERKRSRKRLYPYKEVMEAINRIIDEW